jgi:hypothetical protein
MALVDTNILVFTAILRPPKSRHAVFHFRAVDRLRCIPSPPPPPSNGALTMGPLVGRNPKPYSSPTSFPPDLVRPRTEFPDSVVRLVKRVFKELVGCVLSFRGRATQGASAKAAWAALLLFPRLALRATADFTTAGHLPPDTVADYRDNCLAHWVSRDIDTLFPPLALTYLLPMGGHRHLPHFRRPVPTPYPLRSPFITVSRQR